jgi:hypothetical protein
MGDYSEDWLQHLNKEKTSWEAAKKYKFFDNNSDELVVIFTGQGKLVMFDFYKIFGPVSNKKLDSLFFCDLNDGFYLSGVQGFSKSVEETCEKISDFANKKNYKKISFIGTSMGGFASIMHSIYLKNLQTVKQIKTMVFNPYTSIGKVEYNGMLKKIKPDIIFFLQQRGIPRAQAIELILNYKQEYLNLDHIINNNIFLENIEYTYMVIHGDVEVEIKRCNKLKNLPNLQKLKFPIAQHNIARVLKQENLLLPILEKFVNI